MKIISKREIEAALPKLDLMPAIEAGFVAYSKGEAVVPPVGELLFKEPPGDVHIKYGYLIGDDYYVIKIASGFYQNASLNLPTSNGLMLLFSQNTGELKAVLLDEGLLTDIRTAVAGAIAAKYLAPPQIHRIGIVGTGQQAKLQAKYLREVTPCRQLLVWGRNEQHANRYRNEIAQSGFQVEVASEVDAIVKSCNLIVTATPATKPLVAAGNLQPGTHITAVGSDTPHKQELYAEVLAQADIIVADSLSQCKERGEIAHALQAKAVQEDGIVELGTIIAGNAPGRTKSEQISVVDLTGVAVQDIQIAKAIVAGIS